MMSASTPQLVKPKRLKDLSQTHTHIPAERRNGIRAKDGGWDSDPNVTLKEYSSENDPHCPRAVVSSPSVQGMRGLND